MCDYQLVITPVGGNWFRHFSSLDAAAGGWCFAHRRHMLLALFVFFSLAAFDSAQPVDDYAVSSPYWTAPVVESSDFPAAPIFFYLHNLWNFSAASSAIQTINLISVLDLQVSRRFASSAVHGTFPDEFTIQWVTFSVDCFLDALIMTNTLNPEP